MNSASPGRTAVPGSLHGEGRFLLPRREFEPAYLKTHRAGLLARDYPESARHTIRAMHDQVGELKVDEDGLAVRGVLIRHLVMPGLLGDTDEIMRWLAQTLSRDTFVNLMDQYHPAWKARTDRRYAAINRPLAENEFTQAQALARAAGLWRFDTRWRRGSGANGETPQ